MLLYNVCLTPNQRQTATDGRRMTSNRPTHSTNVGVKARPAYRASSFRIVKTVTELTKIVLLFTKIEKKGYEVLTFFLKLINFAS